MLYAIKSVITITSIVSGALSAWYWLRSSKACIIAKPGAPTAGGTKFVKITMDDGTDFFPTLELQSKLNKKAAVYAAIAAGFMTASSIVDFLQHC
jgi:hypothetical protein